MLRCCICGLGVEDAEAALDNGWLPYFLEGDEEHGPCCPDCFEALLYVDKEGEARLKDRFRGKLIYIEGANSNELSNEDILLTIN